MQAQALGVRTVYLEVGVRNQPARALYEAIGFEEVGRRRRYYANGEDALILRASLDPCAATSGARLASG